MSTIDQTIDVEVPVRMAYDQWTQFEQFPTFMEGVESVSQIDDAHLHWVADIGGVRREWDAEIVEQVPDRIVAWRATDGTQNGGAVTFESVEPGVCRVSLHLDFDPDGFLETVGDKAGFVGRRAAGDLERFKDVVEALPGPTGSWRGAVADGTVIRSDPSGRPR